MQIHILVGCGAAQNRSARFYILCVTILYSYSATQQNRNIVPHALFFLKTLHKVRGCLIFDNQTSVFQKFQRPSTHFGIPRLKRITGTPLSDFSKICPHFIIKLRYFHFSLRYSITFISIFFFQNKFIYYPNFFVLFQ